MSFERGTSKLMRANPHIPLWTQILLLAALNLAILGTVLAIFPPVAVEA
jgi:hypothetical protein